MLKILISIFIYVTMVSAIDIDIKASDGKVTREEINFLVQSFNRDNIKITQENAFKYISQHRILANQYIKDGYLSSDKLKEIQINIENSFSNLYIKLKEKKINLNDDILLSYYKEHREDFFVGKQIEFTYILFETFMDSYKFFIKNREHILKIDFQKIDKKKFKIKRIVKQKMPLKKMLPHFRFLLDENKEKISYLTTPQRDNIGYFLLKIEPITKNENYLPYEMVKDKIKKILLKKNRYTTTEELIDEIKNFK